MTGEKFRVPCVITISRKTWKVTGIEYAELDAVQFCEFGTRLARAHEAGQALQAVREGRTEEEKGGTNNVTFSESAGTC